MANKAPVPPWNADAAQKMGVAGGVGDTLNQPSFEFSSPLFAVSGKIPMDFAKLNDWPKDIQFSQHGGYHERYTVAGDQEVSFVVDVPWGEIQECKEFFLGYSYTDDDGVLHRSIPYQVPKEGMTHLYASSYELLTPEGYVVMDPTVFKRAPDNSVVNVGDDDTESVTVPWPAWCDRSTAGAGNAKVRVVCRPRKYRVASDSQNQAAQQGAGELMRYVIREQKPSVQSLSLPAGALVWAGGPLSGQDLPLAGQYLLMFTAQLVYTWVQVPDPPWDAIGSTIGKVNDADFDGAKFFGKTWPAGTLLCQAPLRIEQYRQCTGRMGWDIAYAFLYRPQGWNNFPTNDGSFWPVTYKEIRPPFATQQPVFASADFNALFKVPASVQYD